MEDLSKLPTGVLVELVPPDAASEGTDLEPKFVVRQHSGLEDMLLSEDSAAEADLVSDADHSTGIDCSHWGVHCVLLLLLDTCKVMLP